jgi:hypothetical protein
MISRAGNATGQSLVGENRGTGRKWLKNEHKNGRLKVPTSIKEESRERFSIPNYYYIEWEAKRG